jgi:hypothetical protein
LSLCAPRVHAEFVSHEPRQQFVDVVEAIVTAPSMLFPWEEINRDEGIWGVVDAAHAVGQQLGIYVRKSRPGFWVSGRSSLRGRKWRAATLLDDVICLLCCSRPHTVLVAL